jgi:hypothetical protein
MGKNKRVFEIRLNYNKTAPQFISDIRPFLN